MRASIEDIKVATEQRAAAHRRRSDRDWPGYGGRLGGPARPEVPSGAASTAALTRDGGSSDARGLGLSSSAIVR